MTRNELAVLPDLTVSRETLERLRAYEALLLKWTQRINLISRHTRQDVWRRHIIDSAQLYPLIRSKSGSWLDLGSGGGLPGVILAILTAEGGRPAHIHMVESDTRKASFLAHVCRELALPATVHAERIERLTPFPVGLITARALASVDQLLSYSVPFTEPSTQILLLKGEKAHSELTAARQTWHSDIEVFESRMDPTGRILSLSNVRKRNDT
ncbi:MAG: 16S rRNA (guanine(527)-N(7))-methyltransferase RsmG [Pseudomonadota bacterium]